MKLWSMHCLECHFSVHIDYFGSFGCTCNVITCNGNGVTELMLNYHRSVLLLFKSKVCKVLFKKPTAGTIYI